MAHLDRRLPVSRGRDSRGGDASACRLVERGKLRPGPVGGEGALERLAGQVEAEPRAKKLQYWLEETAPWAQHAIGEELAAAGLARLTSRRFLGVFLRQPYLEIHDQPVQDEVYRLVRETVHGNRTTMPEAALLVLLVGSAGGLRYHVQFKRARSAPPVPRPAGFLAR